MTRRAEYAKSDRSRCKGCGEYIPKGTLRVGTVNSMQCKWYHAYCFSAPKDWVASDLDGYDGLRPEDQAYLASLQVLPDPPQTQRADRPQRPRAHCRGWAGRWTAEQLGNDIFGRGL